jgi:adenylate cyclase
MLTIPKRRYIELVHLLEAAWVKGIAFDIIFQNADPDEAEFAEVMRKYGNVVISASIGDADKKEGTCAADGTCDGYPRPVYQGVPWGHIDLDQDGLMRKGALPIDPRVLTWSVKRSDAVLLPLPMRLYQLGSPSTTLPTASTLLTPFFSQSDSYKKIPLSTFLKQYRMLGSDFAGKYVLIGESGTSVNDKKLSPVTGKLIDGVEMHAHFLDGLLQDKMLTELRAHILWGAVVILTLFSVMLYFFVPKYLSPIFAIVTIVSILYASRYIYDIHRVLVDISLLFLAGGVITYPVTYMYRFFVVEREKRELQTNFGHYIDPHVVEEIASRDEDIQLGGERRVLSVLFSDIAGFTSISEKMDPQNLFYLMTSYLSNMTDILISRWGTLDKYIGDAVMGFFGAPLSYEDHAIRAADTALMMRSRLPLFNADLVAHGMEPIDFRVGISTGEVMVGNIGSHDRFNYTVLGDTVNVASRLEGMGKEYDVHIIIPESTQGLLTPHFLTRELDTIAVKGKTEGIRIYELVGYSEDIIDRTMYFSYGQALALYRAGDYRSAGKLWQTLAPVDPPSRIMMYRCLEILKGNVTVENWVYHMTHK